MKYQSCLAPVHHSLRRTGPRIRPRGMDYIHCTPEQGEALERIAIDIFNDVCNAGGTFQEALAACYLSGLSHAQEILSSRTDK